MSYSPNKTLNKVKECIKYYNLSKDNEEGFKQLRHDYNNNKIPLRLYVLASYSFNYQLRFNNSFEYNSSFGRKKSSFNSRMEKRLIEFLNKMNNKEIKFYSSHFSFVKNLNLDKNDLVYIDPPYLISTASYNDGKRGYGDWNIEEEKHLLAILNGLNKNGIRFAISNVIKHKGKTNHLLMEWAEQYNIHYLNYNYSNSSYQGKNIKDEIYSYEY
jgi:site-specific DNA-adenine methylase